MMQIFENARKPNGNGLFSFLAPAEFLREITHFSWFIRWFKLIFF
jgi:hypothetical protein